MESNLAPLEAASRLSLGGKVEHEPGQGESEGKYRLIAVPGSLA